MSAALGKALRRRQLPATLIISQKPKPINMQW